MKKKIFKYFKNITGATFIELLLYVAIFLILAPALLSLSVSAARLDNQNTVEKSVNSDIQFIGERIYDLIVSAKKIDVMDSIFEDSEGRLTLVLQDGSIVTIEFNPLSGKIEITEGGQVYDLSSDSVQVRGLHFERIVDALNDPEIIFGITTHLKMSGPEDYAENQEHIISANLVNGDFDEDGAPDHLDKFPRHPQCTGDADYDGVCDELDNCVLEYNPFQEDFDLDEIGDACDASVFFDEEGGDGGGALGAFSCNEDDDLIALINMDPPLPAGELKNILISASPLSPWVLTALIERTNTETPPGHIQQVFILNTELTAEVYQALLEMGLPEGIIDLVIEAQVNADGLAWQDGNNYTQVEYDTLLSVENNQITFYDADNLEGGDYPLGEYGKQNKDVFIISANGGTTDVTVTTKITGVAEANILSGVGSSVVDSLGFVTTLEDIVGNSYAFTVSSVANTEPLESVAFDFGAGAVITSPVNPTYIAHRYLYYCPGGCGENCGDVGTGIITGSIFTDLCYRSDESLPEWCLIWETFANDDSLNPAYMGGTQLGEETLYWEKTFKTVISQSQIDALDSITVAGEIAYQSIAQLFCDTLGSTCLANGNLIGAQDVELYNWDTESWEVVGEIGLNMLTSDQQVFEVIYAGANPQRFIGGEDDRLLKARMQFNWDGIAPESAPTFMVIDYFTLHLKW